MESLKFYENKKNNDFKGKNIIVTGATGGIGSAIAYSLL